MHAALAQPRDERLPWRRGEHGLAAGAGLVRHCAVLGHDEIADGELGARPLELRQLAPGDQDQAAPRVLEPPDRCQGVPIDRAVVRERAVVVGGKGQKVQRLIPFEVGSGSNVQASWPVPAPPNPNCAMIR